MHTEVLAADAKGIARAVETLRAGQTAALPTETVYGLAADALRPEAIAEIFKAKERPAFDPLIVHLPGMDWLERLTLLPTADRPLVETLIARFWPGPFTMVLPRRALVPDLVTAGLETVAVRMSAHPVFAQALKEFGGPLAAPSANRFGRISPTTAQHVFEELDGRIPLIIEGGATSVGLESTVITINKGRIRILRKGPIIAEELSEYSDIESVTSDTLILSPGQLRSHYAPRTPLRLIRDAGSFSPDSAQRVGLLTWKGTESFTQFAEVRTLSAEGNPVEAAANLFRLLRELDAAGLDLIVSENVPESGLGAAIMDRLRRAASR